MFLENFDLAAAAAFDCGVCGEERFVKLISFVIPFVSLYNFKSAL